MRCGSLFKGMLFYLFLVLIVSLFLYPISGYSEVFNVTNEDELRQSLSIAESNGEDDVINIEAGHYRTFGQPFTFETDENYSLALEGEGAGITILDGGEASRVLNINSVLGKQGVNTIIILSKLTIQNGFASADVAETGFGDGAGMRIRNMNYVTIENTEFRNNNAERVGGGICIFSPSQPSLVNLSNNIFTQNTAFGAGAIEVLVAENGMINVNNNVFVDNSAISLNGGGAVIGGDNSFIELVQNRFVGNFAKWSGGGAYIHSGAEAIVTNNIFAQNSCAGSWGGGALFSDLDMLTLTNNTFTMNSTDMFGSALVVDNIPPFQSNIINIYNNIAFANEIIDGSDILLRTSPLPIPTPPPTGIEPIPTNVEYGTINLFNNDVEVYKFDYGSGGYTGCFDFDFYICSIEINEGNNIIEDPIFLDAEAGDFSLQPDSPCIDTGDPNAPDVPDTDIFGNIRVPPPDMGAVEYIVKVIYGESGGGCSMSRVPISSSLAVFLVIPILLLITRIVRKHRKKSAIKVLTEKDHEEDC